MKDNPIRQGRKMKPTLQHRPAIWECMLGTVYAMNDSGEVRYFDYDYDGAKAFAQVTGEKDPRYFRSPVLINYGDGEIRKGQWVLYVRRGT